MKNALEAKTLDTHWNAKAAEVFLKILQEAGKVTRVLRNLHRFKLLEVIIPEFSKARGLMQFNEYHKFTVDEHCLHAVEEAEAFVQEPGAIGQAYREIRRKDVLHLALLIHDLGKGQGKDHSAIGVDIAIDLEKRLGLGPEKGRILAFLVGKHLLMTHIAFRRDLSDEKVILQFAQSVRTPEILRMLYIMTLADVSAVGPGTLTAWKKDLLAELYSNTLEILTGERVVMAQEEKINRVRERILARPEFAGESGVRDQVSQMTNRYLLTTSQDHILRHLNRLPQLSEKRVLVDSEYDAVRHITEYTVYASGDLISGVFYKIAGALAAKGLQILAANITTLRNDVIVDVFQVQDKDFSGAPTPKRMEKVSLSIQDVLLGRVPVEELLVQGWRLRTDQRRIPRPVPTQVELDNGSSEEYSIIEVFAQDGQGLLFIIARAIFELGLSVHTSKVSTQLDQIVDVFYVKDRAGLKIEDPALIQKIKLRLTQEIEHFHEEAQGRPSFAGSGEGEGV